MLTYPHSSCIGVGLTMEGIYQNYAIYQYALDRYWSMHKKFDSITWYCFIVTPIICV
jgi:hypothetical protein